MADAELRALERAALSGGKNERLAFANALARAGRRRQAIDAVARDRDDAGVRALLATMPGWWHHDAERIHNGFLDVAPVRSAPVERWRTPREPSRGYEYPFNLDLLASPLAVVTRSGPEIVVLDPETGQVQRGLARGHGGTLLEIRGTLVLIGNMGRFAAFDVDKAKQRWAKRVYGPNDMGTRGLAVEVQLRDGAVLAGSRIALDGRPETKPLWRFPRKGRLDTTLADFRVITVGPERVVFWGEDDKGREGFVVLDATTGDEVFRGDGAWIHVDALGIVVSDGAAVVAHDSNGRKLWRTMIGPKLAITALSPELVVVRTGKKIVAVDRTSGKMLGVLGVSLRTHAVVRDVIYLAGTQRSPARSSRMLEARLASGKLLWSLKLEGVVRCCVPQEERLYLLLDSESGSEILCLAEPRDG
jgi:hypothetical protein